MTWSVGAGLEGRGVICTGAGGGIGRATAIAVASAGARVLAVDVRGERAEETLALLPGEGHAALATDLADLRTHAALVATAQRGLGSLWGLAHMAAVLRRAADIDAVSEEDWDVQTDVNMKASFFLFRTCANALRDAGAGGRIVGFTSQGWWTGGFGGSVVYAAGKGGIVSMTRGLARTYGPHGICVNAVSPGLIETPMLTDGLSDEAYRSLIAATPLGRVGTPEEIAGVVVFLLSQHASYVSGATINVSGGFLMY